MWFRSEYFTLIEKKSKIGKKLPKDGSKKLPNEGGIAVGDKMKKSVKTYKIYILKVLK